MNHHFGTTDPAIYGAGGTHAFFSPQIHIAARTALFRRAVIKTAVADFNGKNTGNLIKILIFSDGIGTLNSQESSKEIGFFEENQTLVFGIVMSGNPKIECILLVLLADALSVPKGFKLGVWMLIDFWT